MSIVRRFLPDEVIGLVNSIRVCGVVFDLYAVRTYHYYIDDTISFVEYFLSYVRNQNLFGRNQNLCGRITDLRID